jgi:hypothetical protein
VLNTRRWFVYRSDNNQGIWGVRDEISADDNSSAQAQMQARPQTWWSFTRVSDVVSVLVLDLRWIGGSRLWALWQ